MPDPAGSHATDGIAELGSTSEFVRRSRQWVAAEVEVLLGALVPRLRQAVLEAAEVEVVWGLPLEPA